MAITSPSRCATIFAIVSILISLSGPIHLRSSISHGPSRVASQLLSRNHTGGNSIVDVITDDQIQNLLDSLQADTLKGIKTAASQTQRARQRFSKSKSVPPALAKAGNDGLDDIVRFLTNNIPRTTQNDRGTQKAGKPSSTKPPPILLENLEIFRIPSEVLMKQLTTTAKTTTTTTTIKPPQYLTFDKILFPKELYTGSDKSREKYAILKLRPQGPPKLSRGKTETFSQYLSHEDQSYVEFLPPTDDNNIYKWDTWPQKRHGHSAPVNPSSKEPSPVPSASLNNESKPFIIVKSVEIEPTPTTPTSVYYNPIRGFHYPNGTRTNLEQALGLPASPNYPNNLNEIDKLNNFKGSMTTLPNIQSTFTQYQPSVTTTLALTPPPVAPNHASTPLSVQYIPPAPTPEPYQPIPVSFQPPAVIGASTARWNPTTRATPHSNHVPRYLPTNGQEWSNFPGSTMPPQPQNLWGQPAQNLEGQAKNVIQPVPGWNQPNNAPGQPPAPAPPPNPQQGIVWNQSNNGYQSHPNPPPNMQQPTPGWSQNNNGAQSQPTPQSEMQQPTSRWNPNNNGVQSQQNHSPMMQQPTPGWDSNNIGAQPSPPSNTQQPWNQNNNAFPQPPGLPPTQLPATPTWYQNPNLPRQPPSWNLNTVQQSQQQIFPQQPRPEWDQPNNQIPKPIPPQQSPPGWSPNNALTEQPQMLWTQNNMPQPQLPMAWNPGQQQKVEWNNQPPQIPGPPLQNWNGRPHPMMVQNNAQNQPWATHPSQPNSSPPQYYARPVEQQPNQRAPVHPNRPPPIPAPPPAHWEHGPPPPQEEPEVENFPDPYFKIAENSEDNRHEDDSRYYGNSSPTKGQEYQSQYPQQQNRNPKYKKGKGNKYKKNKGKAEKYTDMGEPEGSGWDADTQENYGSYESTHGSEEKKKKKSEWFDKLKKAVFGHKDKKGSGWGKDKDKEIEEYWQSTGSEYADNYKAKASEWWDKTKDKIHKHFDKSKSTKSHGHSLYSVTQKIYGISISILAFVAFFAYIVALLFQTAATTLSAPLLSGAIGLAMGDGGAALFSALLGRSLNNSCDEKENMLDQLECKVSAAFTTVRKITSYVGK